MIVGTDASYFKKLSKSEDCHLRYPASSQTAYVSTLIPFRMKSESPAPQIERVLMTSISSSSRMPLQSTLPSLCSFAEAFAEVDCALALAANVCAHDKPTT